MANAIDWASRPPTVVGVAQGATHDLGASASREAHGGSAVASPIGTLGHEDRPDALNGLDGL